MKLDGMDKSTNAWLTECMYARRASETEVHRLACEYYGLVDVWIPNVHVCNNPFGTCVYDADDLGEFCVECGDPYEQK